MQKILINTTDNIFDVSQRAFAYLIETYKWPVKVLETLDDIDTIKDPLTILDFAKIEGGEGYDFLLESLFSIQLRSDPRIIEAFEKLQEDMNTINTKLTVIELEDDIEPLIARIDGIERVIDSRCAYPKAEDNN